MDWPGQNWGVRFSLFRTRNYQLIMISIWLWCLVTHFLKSPIMPRCHIRAVAQLEFDCLHLFDERRIIKLLPKQISDDEMYTARARPGPALRAIKWHIWAPKSRIDEVTGAYMCDSTCTSMISYNGLLFLMLPPSRFSRTWTTTLSTN